MNPKTAQQQLVQFLSTTIAVAIGAIIAITYTTWEEEKKPPQPLIIRIDNWQEINWEEMAKRTFDEWKKAVEEERNQ